MPAAVKLNICAIASEVVPFAKSGGLADVASALSRQLTVAGHDVRLFMPFYSRVKRDNLGATRVESTCPASSRVAACKRGDSSRQTQLRPRASSAPMRRTVGRRR